MADVKQPGRLMVDRATKPLMPRYLKLRHDAGRDRWVLLAPERILTPDAIAVAVLKLCDGERTVDDIAANLAAEYSAPADVIAADVVELLQDLADKGYIKG
ncbi:MAG: pyrroloquinoline quinone biosynthesis peptide chaperone PqqD [Methyloceanibacter sp.]|jgi:pyrroloquinoline quinone biosynthesis protein D|uniref:pyrroloquinoline quinone biosynthesis peptide chaperone PqqD n=1 Tax=Methyloceanibacter sp. TaxID=1965321 RepID=UPI000E862300|nr:pyrroloquinoline quinone biosynthesis peptide chaperone PqqD [Methyloceanibacter sp.]